MEYARREKKSKAKCNGFCAFKPYKKHNHGASLFFTQFVLCKHNGLDERISVITSVEYVTKKHIRIVAEKRPKE